MKQYEIQFKCQFPFGSSKPFYKAYVKLSDEEVQSIHTLIRNNGGSYDPETIQLAEELPEVYKKLDYACADVASEAAFAGWAIHGFECGYFDTPEDLMERCEADGLFKYEPEDIEDFLDEDGQIDQDMLDDDKSDVFSDWVDEYFETLNENDKLSFLMKYFTEALDEYPGVDFTYEVCLPEAIVELI